jgi:DNA-binding winged helix-turn-helix (wHTH) protein/TolB-like protein
MTYRFGIFEFDDRAAILTRSDRAVALEPQPARALGLLLARAGDVVTRDELRAHLWGEGTHVDFDRGLAYCIGQLRAALGDSADNPRFVQTLPRRGYRFIAPVTAARADRSTFGVRGSSLVRRSSFDVQGSSFDVQGSSSDVQGSSFDVQGSSSDVQGSSFDVQGSSFDVQGSSFDVQGSSSDVQGSSLNVEPRTTNDERRTTNVEPRTTNDVRRSTRGALLLAAAAVFSTVVVVGWWSAARNGAPVRPIVAVAVFDNETGDASRERAVATIADVVVERLTAIGPNRIGVNGNSKVLRNPRADRDPRTVARETQAAFLIAGHLQTKDGRLSLLMHIIRLDDGTHVWVQRISRSPDDALESLDEDVAAQIEKAVRRIVLKDGVQVS